MDRIKIILKWVFEKVYLIKYSLDEDRKNDLNSFTIIYLHRPLIDVFRKVMKEMLK